MLCGEGLVFSPAMLASPRRATGEEQSVELEESAPRVAAAASAAETRRVGSTGSTQRTQWLQVASVPLQLFCRLVLLPCDSLPTPWRRTFQLLVPSGDGTMHSIPSTVNSPGCITTHVERVHDSVLKRLDSRLMHAGKRTMFAHLNDDSSNA